jgi:hypothetical protein
MIVKATKKRGSDVKPPCCKVHCLRGPQAQQVCHPPLISEIGQCQRLYRQSLTKLDIRSIYGRYSSGRTCTGDKRRNLPARLPPNFRTRATKVGIKVAPVLHRDHITSCSAETDFAETDLELIGKESAGLRVGLLFLIPVERCVSVPIPIPVPCNGHGDSDR